MSSFERNIIHISFSGGNDMVTLQESDKILVFNQQTNTFDEVSRLQQRRRLHSVSLVSMSDYTCAATTTPTTTTPTGEISSILIIDLYIPNYHGSLAVYANFTNYDWLLKHIIIYYL